MASGTVVYYAEWLDAAGRIQSFEYNLRQVKDGWVFLSLTDPLEEQWSEVMLPPSMASQVTIKRLRHAHGSP